jgi:hypothetical protein
VEVIMRHLADAVLAGSAQGRAAKGKDKDRSAPEQQGELVGAGAMDKGGAE